MIHPRARPFVVYYGWLTDGPHGEPNADARRIAAAAQPLVIAQPWTAPPAGHVNLSPQVLKLMLGAGTEVYAYVATGFGRGDVKAAGAALEAAAALTVTGVFLDEVDPLIEDAKLMFYSELTDRARAHNLKVIVNTGVARSGERLMALADRLMVEHQWRGLLSGSRWALRYDRDRFMGISSNEENAMGYVVDEAHAAQDAREAWQACIGWHAATDRYTRLPEWFR